MFPLAPWRMVERLPMAQPLNRLYQSLDEVANQFFGNWPPPFSPQEMVNRLGVEVDEQNSEVIIRADAPGYDAEDFNIEIHGDLLTIRAEHRQENAQNCGRDYTYSTRRFYRSVNVPRGVQTENVNARYRNGVLEIHLQKNPEHKGKRIPVAGG